MNGSNRRRFLTVAEVTEILGQSVATTHRRLREGSIPFTKLGGRILIPAEFIDELAKSAFASTSEGGR